MERHVLSLLCDPDTRYPLELTGNNLRNTATGRIYPIRDEIPLFVSTVKGPNLKYQTMYDYIAPGYDVAGRLFNWARGRSNCRGELVKEIQRGVGIVADGVFGAGTEAAVRQFQRDHGMTPDGIVGPKTWAAFD